MFTYVCLLVDLCVCVVAGRVQRGALDPLELELQLAVRAYPSSGF